MKPKRIIVIGAGASGLIAAGQAALAGAEVTLLEKQGQTGRKLRITGKGRCNLTNTAELPEFIEAFGQQGRFLRQAFHRFFTPDLVALMGELGVEVNTERGGRVFPVNNDAVLVAETLEHWAKRAGAKLKSGCAVKSLKITNGRVSGVTTGNTELDADAVIIATGGKSYPATGSTGDGYRLAEQAGHTIVPPRPALVPLTTGGPIAKRLQGLSLKNVTATAYIDGKKTADEFGEMLFTHYGLSGPIILTLSRDVVVALEAKQAVEISIDLKPALDEAKLDARLLRDIAEHGKKQFKGMAKSLLPQKLIPVCFDLTGIPADRPANQVSAADRKRLRIWLKDFRLTVTGHRGFDEAIVTAGGVATPEIDPRTMHSRRVDRLYFCGEVIDIDGTTGGFNLQAAFSTGWLAGVSATAD